MGATRIAVFAIVLLVVVFATGIGLGAQRATTGSKDVAQFDPPVWIRRIDAWLGGLDRPIDAKALSSDCVRTGKTYFLSRRQPSCEIGIRATDPQPQTLRLALEGPVPSIEVINTVTQSGRKTSAVLQRGETLRLPVFSGGATLELACPQCAATQQDPVRVTIR